jgi:thiol-disulfide isomerase/thioredoxin
MREHTELLSQRPKQVSVKVMAGPGERSKPFDAITVDGDLISDADLTGGRTLVGILANGCTSCEERRPEFIELARRFPGGRDRVLAVLVSGSEDADVSAERASIEPIARLALQERPGIGITQALGVTGYPAFALFDADGTVLSSGTSVEDLDLSLAGV